MTWFEARAYTVLWVAKLLRIKMRDLRDSYPYNPLVQAEVDEAFTNLHIRLGERYSITDNYDTER